MRHSDISARIAALGVPSGTSKRFNCISCGGKNTLGVTNDRGKLSWHCFRASCGIKGKLGVGLSLSDLKTINKQKQEHKFILPDYFTYVTNEKALDWLHRFNCTSAINKRLVDVRYDPKEDRIVFLIKDREGETRDAVGRSMGLAKPKWRRYGSSRLPLVVGNMETVSVVEDAASACAVSELTTGLCILGTHLTAEAIAEIRRYKQCYIALDPDAKLKALRMQKALQGYLPTKLLLLPDDPKCFTTEELKILINKT